MDGRFVRNGGFQSLSESKNTAADMKLVWTLPSLRRGEKILIIPKTNRAKWPLQSGTSQPPLQTQAHTHARAHTCIVNAFHFKVLPIFWWHSHSSRVKQHLAASISIIKYFKQHPASTPVTPLETDAVIIFVRVGFHLHLSSPHTFTSYQSLCQDAK